jgi:sugar/nucleoside kinase (ribokinase family)
MSAPNRCEVLGIGNPFLDHLILVTDAYLNTIPGAKGGMEPVDYKTFRRIIDENGDQVNIRAGGSSANTIKGLAELGHRCGFAGRAGGDEAGQMFVKKLEVSNIIPYMTYSQSTATGQLACLITPDGQRTFRNYLGATQEMGAEDLHPGLFSGVSLVHIEGYTLLNDSVTQRAVELAKASQAKVSFTLGSFEVASGFKNQILSLLAKHVDIVFANAEETKALTRLPPEQGIDVLKELCEIAIVTIGAEGCWIASKSKKIHCPAFPVIPLDTTGAGDLFAAGFLHGYLKDKDLPECARFGALVAAEVVQVLGAEISPTAWQRLRAAISNDN